MTNKEIEQLKEKIEELKAEVSDLENGDNEKDFEDFLNESYGDVNVCGYIYESGRVLKEIDPIAFNTGLSDYNDSRITDLNSDIEELETELKELEESVD